MLMTKRVRYCVSCAGLSWWGKKGGNMKPSTFIDKFYSKILLVFSLIIIPMIAFSIYLYSILPNIIPINFEFKTTFLSMLVNRNVGKEYLFVLPFIYVILCILFSDRIIYRFFPKQEQRYVAQLICLLCLSLLTVIIVFIYLNYF